MEKQLEGGPRPAGNPNSDQEQPGTLLQDARDAGYVWRTVQRAAAAMSVMRARAANGTVWLLPTLPA
jgi:hypothetical protein